MLHLRAKIGLTASVIALSASAALAAELSLMISDVDAKGPVVAEMVQRYMDANPGVTITLNQVGYNVIREQLPVQLEAGTGPDLAFVTNLGGLNPYYVDLTPYVDADAWEAAYGSVLPWYRAGAPDGIFGYHTEMTVTGPYVNLTMFEEAGVEVLHLAQLGKTGPPPRKVLWTTALMRAWSWTARVTAWLGPAMSYGAAYLPVTAS